MEVCYNASFMDVVCIYALDTPWVRLTLVINQWPDNPQLFTNPHWLSVHNVYCLPVIGMNNIPTQKNNMLRLWFFLFENRMFNWTAHVDFFLRRLSEVLI